MIGLGNGVRVSNTAHVSNSNNHLSYGKNVFIGHFCYIDAFNAQIKIGEGVQITNYVSILTHSSHNAIRFDKSEISQLKDSNNLLDINPISIGEKTYIGPHTVIMPGTNIGVNCIVGAFSYVSGDIPDYSVVRGTPAKIVGDTREIDDELVKKTNLDETV